MLPINTPAPAFTLSDHQNKNISLSDFTGKWLVLYFYPKAMTPGCTVQACALRDHLDAFSEKNICVLGVSADSPAKIQKFIERDHLNFPLAGDISENKDMLKAYEAWGPKKFMGREYEGILRITYIIDPEGNIKHTFPKVKTKTHHDDIRAWFTAENII